MNARAATPGAPVRRAVLIAHEATRRLRAGVPDDCDPAGAGWVRRAAEPFAPRAAVIVESTIASLRTNGVRAALRFFPYAHAVRVGAPRRGP